jgi:hypothetical protein
LGRGGRSITAGSLLVLVYPGTSGGSAT